MIISIVFRVNSKKVIEFRTWLIKFIIIIWISFIFNFVFSVLIITVDNNKISDNTVIGSGNSKIDIDGGIGEINIKYSE